MLADAVADLQEHYGVKVLSGPAAMWLALGMACVSVYGPKVVVIAHARKIQKAARNAPKVPEGAVDMTELQDAVAAHSERQAPPVVPQERGGFVIPGDLKAA